MIKQNWHTHTSRCGHAVGDDQEYVEAALAAKVQTLGFSDHVPFPVSSPHERMDMDQLPDYIRSVERLKKIYADKLPVYLGLEIEYYPDQLDYLRELRKRMDYLILGQHSMDLDGESSYFLHTPQQLHRYCDRIEEACANHLPDYICHPDVCLWSYPRYDEAVYAVAQRLADIALHYDLPVELNCGSGVRDYGLREYEDGQHYAYPSIPFFSVFAKRHVPVVIGMDIHDPAHFLTDQYLRRALHIVQGLDLNILENYDVIAHARREKNKL